MKQLLEKCMTVAAGETSPQGVATPDATVRFWIITILLVLVGLSTLKIR